MEAFAIYLLKSSGLLLLFWGTYHLFLRKETLFKENRWFLLSGMLISFLLPLIKRKEVITVDLIPTAGNALPAAAGYSPTAPDSIIGLDQMVLLVYLIGCLFFTVRFLLQLNRINRLKKSSDTWKEDDLRHVRTKKHIAPFSFFKSLFYNPNQFKEEELQLILSHEKVHAKEWHSIDVILGEILKIALWWNPLVWNYHKTIKQNLEFLADASAITHCNRKSYQFLMLSQATGQQLVLTNPFYNSLIKKRIVMLNKKQSKQMNALKTLLIVPLLAIFLVSFSTEKVYEFDTQSETDQMQFLKSIELLISKTTTNEQLEKMKGDLAKDGIDFSYTAVRNDTKEIIDISLHVSGKGDNGATFNNSHSSSDSKNGISPLVIFIDRENNSVFIGSKGSYKSIGNGEKSVWITSDDEGHKEVIIKKEDGVSKVFIDGEEVDEDDLHEHDIKIHIDEDMDHDDGDVMHFITDGKHKNKKHVKVKKRKGKNGNSVMIIKDSDDDHDIEVMDDEGFFFIDTDGEEPLYILDGKEVSAKVVKEMSPKNIETIEVSKGKAAVKKFGKKSKNGVVEITSKKKN